MKTLILYFLLMVSASVSFGQDVKKALDLLQDLEDYNGKEIDIKKMGDEIVIVSIPMTDQPFRVYDQLKGKKYKENVALVGGFSKPGSHTEGVPIGHLKTGFVERYGSDFASIWLDPNTSVGEALGLKGHAIVNVSVKKMKIVKVQDFGNKVDDFVKALDQLKK